MLSIFQIDKARELHSHDHIQLVSLRHQQNPPAMKLISLPSKFTLYTLSILILASCSGTSTQDRAPDTSQNPKEVNTRKQPAKYRGVAINRAEGQLYQPAATQSLDFPPRLSRSSKGNSIEDGNANTAGYRVLPTIEGARVIHDGDRRWVEVDSGLDEAWAIMKAFWENSGIGLTENSLEAGIMETECIQSPTDVVEA
ncbi:MAG: outer membrane protein assembly factor BamC [Gammaproteobacteria bacterium]|nr:outer membrane protein assembly factor BamC [Gammaproteobacteria bacterium]